jgi:hypothetical protein|tara:strand:+ start:275 stop:703 length:429 start_codon:yes stop_codon:yes gene_type:complete
MFKALLLILLSAIVVEQTSDQMNLTGMPAEISEIMQNQQNAWNSGDIEGFMIGYWDSEELLFIGNSVNNGYETTLSNYKKSYPTREDMGSLEFTNLIWVPVSSDAGLLIGEWNLIGINNGMYSLLWKKMEGEWLIIADHSSD